jgi:hypothetical protein
MIARIEGLIKYVNLNQSGTCNTPNELGETNEEEL